MITYTGKTLQQISDETAAALIKQGGQCKDPDGDCVYGDGNGNHCAIGLGLPADNDNLMGFTGGVSELIRDFDDIGENTQVIKSNAEFFDDLQSAHDTVTNNLNRHLGKLKDWHGIDTSAWKGWRKLIPTL